MVDAAWSIDLPGLSVERLPPTRAVVVRIGNSKGGARVRLGKLLGRDLPLDANCVARIDPGLAYWTRPGEWLIIGDLPPLRAFSDAIGTDTGIASEAGDGLVAFRIRGPRGLDLLAKATSLDPVRSIGPGRCAQTQFARIKALVSDTGDGACDVQADVTYSSYLQAWFIEATLEFAPTEVPA